MPATILVIDDNTLVREVVQGLLKVAGFHVLGAGEGIAALAAYAAEGADGAIVDMDMPGMNGLEVCRELRLRAKVAHRPLQLWLMTGVVRPELVEDAQAAGAQGVLAKPFTRDELLRCFSGLLVQHSEHALAS